MNPMQTIPLMGIAMKQAKALRDSELIRDFCLSKYNKLPQIIIGHNVKKKPGRDDCPAILIPRMGKIEGEDSREFKYFSLVGWMIVNDQETEAEDIRILTGLEESDALGQMIYETLCLLNPDYPVSESHYEIDAVEFFPQIVGEMQLNITVPRTMGMAMKY